MNREQIAHELELWWNKQEIIDWLKAADQILALMPKPLNREQLIEERANRLYEPTYFINRATEEYNYWKDKFQPVHSGELRERIARFLCDKIADAFSEKDFAWTFLNEYDKQWFLEQADQILSLIKYVPAVIPENFPEIVCLCGSTRFGDAFRKAQLDETLAGRIVLTIGCNMKTDAEIFGHLPEGDLKLIKAGLDELHKRKIDLANSVLILNVGGYIGESTRSELEYAKSRGKVIRYLEPIS